MRCHDKQTSVDAEKDVRVWGLGFRVLVYDPINREPKGEDSEMDAGLYSGL